MLFSSTVPGVSSVPIRKPRKPVTTKTLRHFGPWHVFSYKKHTLPTKLKSPGSCPDCSVKVTRIVCTACKTAAISDIFASALRNSLRTEKYIPIPKVLQAHSKINLLWVFFVPVRCMQSRIYRSNVAFTEVFCLSSR